MKNIALLLSLLVASVVMMSAVPSFSSSGPFGAFGPANYSGKADAGKKIHTSTREGTGPYGAFASIDAMPGEVSKRAATPGGSGPFGAFISYGMIPDRDSTTVNKKDGCILLAKDCTGDR